VGDVTWKLADVIAPCPGCGRYGPIFGGISGNGYCVRCVDSGKGPTEGPRW